MALKHYATEGTMNGIMHQHVLMDHLFSLAQRILMKDGGILFKKKQLQTWLIETKCELKIHKNAVYV